MNNNAEPHHRSAAGAVVSWSIAILAAVLSPPNLRIWSFPAGLVAGHLLFARFSRKQGGFAPDRHEVSDSRPRENSKTKRTRHFLKLNRRILRRRGS